jgi:hypothetical protein
MGYKAAGIRWDVRHDSKRQVFGIRLELHRAVLPGSYVAASVGGLVLLKFDLHFNGLAVCVVNLRHVHWVLACFDRNE